MGVDSRVKPLESALPAQLPGQRETRIGRRPLPYSGGLRLQTTATAGCIDRTVTAVGGVGVQRVKLADGGDMGVPSTDWAHPAGRQE